MFIIITMAICSLVIPGNRKKPSAPAPPLPTITFAPHAAPSLGKKSLITA